MNTHLLLASAFRTLIMGVTLFAALRILRIHQVRAQRTAWLLALIAALAMPAFVHGSIGFHVLPSFAPPARTSVLHVADAVSSSRGRVHVAMIPAARAQRYAANIPAQPHHQRRHWPLSYASTLYCLVAGFLLIRLGTGFAVAMRLRNQSERAETFFSSDAFSYATDIRISHRIATPVTIATSVLLPASSAQWSEEKLRVVLSHERAHIRQHDFYLQLLAGLNCAIFWFNPFSWWLQKHLSALGEAMSDHAALEQAESRVSYAEVLLEFATSAQWPLTGVAMARTSSLRIRIERILSEQLFEQSYTGRRRLTILAAAISLVAVCASTSLVRVQASRSMSTTATVTTSRPTRPAAVVQPRSSSGAQAPSAVSSVNGGPSSGVSGKTIAPSRYVAVVQENQQAQQETQDAPTAPAAPVAPPTPAAPEEGDHSNYTYAYNNNGDSYALVSGSGSYTFSGDWNQAGSFEAIRKGIHGDFIYYRHDGKSYVIDDPTIVARAKALYAPIEALGKQQEALGKEQEALGRQQEALGRLQSNVKIKNPDLSKETAALDKALQQMRQLQSEKEVDRESLSRLQEQIGEIQGRLGELQGEAGEQQGKFGAEQGALGEQQGKLGEEQGRLGEQQGKLGEEAHRQIMPLIQQAIQDGKARPVN